MRQIMTTTTMAIATLFALLSFTPVAQGQLVEYVFEGVFTTADPVVADLLGNTIRGNYQVLVVPPDNNPSPNVGNYYQGVALGAQVTFELFDATGTPGLTGGFTTNDIFQPFTVTVLNDFGPQVVDEYEIQAGQSFPGADTPLTVGFNLTLTDASGTALDNDALLGNPLALINFSSGTGLLRRQFPIGGGFPPDIIVGTATFQITSFCLGADLAVCRQDCNNNGIADSDDITLGTSLDCNLNGLPDECEPDCNTNGVPDECDITAGTSFDTNFNGIPDECEDCNANGIPDGTDILNLTSADCNANGLPDECEISITSTAPGGPFFCLSGCDTDCNNNGIPDFCDGLDLLNIQKLTTSTAGDFFGPVALQGLEMLVGAPRDDQAGPDAGAVYVFELDTITGNWNQVQKILNPGGTQFGSAISIDGNKALVAKVNAVIVLQKTGNLWIEEAVLTIPPIVFVSGFGTGVALSGNTAIVGALDLNFLSGAAFVYRFDGVNWNMEQTLTAPDASPFDDFGRDVEVIGDIALIGRRNIGGPPFASPDSGGVYVYLFDGVNWVFDTKLIASDGQLLDQFGFDVSFDGDTVVIGAPGDDVGASGTGSAYVFRLNVILGTWIEEAQLVAPDAASGDVFGSDVALSGNTVIVGALGDDDLGSSSGSAYVFTRNGTTWTFMTKLTAFDGAAGDNFSNSIAIDGVLAAIGATKADPLGLIDAGEVNALNSLIGFTDCDDNGVLDMCDPLTDCNNNGLPDVCEVDCNSNGVPDDCDITSGFSADINNNSIPDECEDCNNNRIFDGFDIKNGTSQDCDGNGLPDECQSNDCNGNGIPDGCDVSNGTSLDCNLNGIPDSCDIASGTSLDGNLNGVPDECECTIPGCSYDCGSCNNQVDVADLLQLLADWGAPAGQSPCDPGINGVDMVDLLSLLAAWGPCP